MLEQTVDIRTRDGSASPERGGPHPAVLMLMDAPGIREELRDMARRLGTAGYAALLRFIDRHAAAKPGPVGCHGIA